MERAVAERLLGKPLMAAAGLALALALPGLALAQAKPPAVSLTQIDAGPAVPASPYFSFLIAGEEQAGVLQGVVFPMVSRLRPAPLAGASPAVLDGRWMTQPIFVIGADARSHDWLERHAEALRQSGAAGLVLSAPSAEAFKRVQRLASQHNLPLAPGPDPWLEQQLIDHGVGVVPLVIGLDGRVQEAP